MELGNTHNDVLTLNHDALTTHAAVFGSTGSGKTGLLVGMVEELYHAEVPVILVDIKGDMVNVALQEVKWQVRCLTPGATHGEAVNVLADLEDPDKASSVVAALLSMVGEDPDPISGSSHPYLSAVLDSLEERTLENLVQTCHKPNLHTLGGLSLDSAFPAKARLSLARKLNNLLVSNTFKAWRRGMDLDIDNLVTHKGITVYSVAHLHEGEQAFAISFLLNEVLRWTKAQKGSDELRLVLAIDECVGLLPPAPANPSTKEPIMLLLKQARAFGVGLILATQNPVDIDYKAMSNCATWFVGRMTADKDRKRVIAGMVAAGVSADVDIAGLKPREFVMARHDAGNMFMSRNVDCELRGPMVPMEIVDLYDSFNLGYGNGANFIEAEKARGRVEEEDTETIVTENVDLFDPEPMVEATEQLIEEEYLISDEVVELGNPLRTSLMIGLGWGLLVVALAGAYMTGLL